MKFITENYFSKLVLVIIFVFWCVPAQAQLPPDLTTFLHDEPVDTLRGLTGILVAIDDPGSELIKEGLNLQQIQMDVEFRLRKAGIRILTGPDFMKTPGAPCLSVQIDTLKRGKDNFYLYSISIKLRQNIILERYKSRSYRATTWETGVIGGISASQIKLLRTNLGNLVDQFINDYRSVNQM